MTAPGWDDADLHGRDPLRPLAARLGCTTGQAWSLSGGTVVAVALLAASLLRGPGVAQSASGDVVLPPPLAVALPAAPPAAVVVPEAPAPVPAGPVPAAPVPPVLPGAPADVGGPVVPGPALPGAPRPAAAPPSASPAPASPRPSAPPAAAEPLRVLDGGWYTRDATLAAQTRGFPVTDYPVAADPRGDSRHSFVHLAGTTTTLVLRVDPDATTSFGTPAVLACPTATSRWTPAPEQSSFPAFRTAGCVPGVPSADGTRFAFDLSALPDRTGPEGVTLVADPASTAPFQTAFLPGPGDTP